ncbi:MAG: hypothetical protein ACC645_06875, partial [Pirellulales bacterium]
GFASRSFPNFGSCQASWQETTMEVEQSRSWDTRITTGGVFLRFSLLGKLAGGHHGGQTVELET